MIATDLYQVFVYGTLKHGYRNHRVLSDSRFICDAESCESLALFDAGAFPAITHGGDLNVQGELYECDEDTVRRLDRLEGEGVMYKKEEQDFMTTDGRKISAWIYVWLPSTDGLKSITEWPSEHGTERRLPKLTSRRL